MSSRARTAAHPGVAALALLLLGPWASSAPAAPRAELWERWLAHDARSEETVDHRVWQTFLSRHVRASSDGINRVDYAGAKADRARLRGYLRDLSLAAVSRLPRPEQKAYWLNLYNALTVAVVLDHYPVDSIKSISISPGLFSVGPWGKKLVEVEGEALSLDDIEHRILRPIWKDPRIHYGVNCASLGCPNLLATAFTGANVERLLDEGARAYVNHPRGARVENGRLRVSSIYRWFEADFGGDDAGVIAHLRRHAGAALRASLEGVGEVDGHGYDWALNDVSAPGS